jgi:hypothetical protein
MYKNIFMDLIPSKRRSISRPKRQRCEANQIGKKKAKGPGQSNCAPGGMPVSCFARALREDKLRGAGARPAEGAAARVRPRDKRSGAVARPAEEQLRAYGREDERRWGSSRGWRASGAGRDGARPTAGATVVRAADDGQGRYATGSGWWVPTSAWKVERNSVSLVASL